LVDPALRFSISIAQILAIPIRFTISIQGSYGLEIKIVNKKRGFTSSPT